MDLSRVILGQVVTEKAERLKADETHRTYTLRVAPDATKIAIGKALEKYFDVSVESVRVLKVQPKTRQLSQHSVMEKRHASKRAMVTLAKKSKALDLSAFEA
jgi:ribosomal protein L23